jgi:hypothetical protein
MLKTVENCHSGFIQVSIQVKGVYHKQVKFMQKHLNLGFGIPPYLQLQ